MVFDNGDIDAARNLVGEIKKEVAAQWKIDTTISDLETSLALINDTEKRKEFDSLTAQLRALL
ncbi:MAG: hypothetical protein WC799_14855 [Desulfobacteraceae bacterium]|jgi:hypothetical protein